MIPNASCLNLLGSCFPGIKTNILRCESNGIAWISKPFVKEANGETISHVGLLDYPMLINGQRVKAAGLHAICTREDYREQGLSSELILEALAFADERYDLVILFTEIPEFYEKLSFHTIKEHQFRLPVAHKGGTKSLTPMKVPEDVALLRKCFDERASLSNLMWVDAGCEISAFNALFATYPDFWSLHYSSSLDAIISFELEGKTLRLFDIVAKQLPSLEQILDHMPSEIEEIYFYFSPDLFAKDTASEPQRYDDGFFMVRGNWTQDKPFMIPLLSRC